MPFFGEISALITAALWGGGSLAFTAAIRRLGSVQVNVTRILLATVLLFVTVIVLRFPLSITAYQFMFLALSGIVGLVFGDSFLFRAFQEVGPRISMLILSFAPAITAVLGYVFLGETLAVMSILGILLTLLGIAAVITDRPRQDSSPITRRGLAFGFLGALGQGAGLVLAKVAFLDGDLNEMVATFVRLSVAAVVITPVMRYAGLFKNPIRLFSREKAAFGFTLLGAILGPYLGITFSLLAITHTKVGIAATLMATTPVLMLPMVRYIQKERLSWRAIGGACVAVAGVAILFLHV